MNDKVQNLNNAVIAFVNEDDVEKITTQQLQKVAKYEITRVVKTTFPKVIKKEISEEFAKEAFKKEAISKGFSDAIKKVASEGFGRAVNKLTVITDVAFILRLSAQPDELKYKAIDNLILLIDKPDSYWTDRRNYTLKDWEKELFQM